MNARPDALHSYRSAHWAGPSGIQDAILTRPVLVDIGARLTATPAQVALAWMLDLARNVLLIPGTRTTRHLAENITSAGVRIDAASRAEISRYFPTVPAS